MSAGPIALLSDPTALAHHYYVLTNAASGTANIGLYNPNLETGALSLTATYDAGGTILAGDISIYTHYLYVLVNRTGALVIRGFKLNTDGTLGAGFDAATGGNLRLTTNPQIRAMIFPQDQTSTDLIVVPNNDANANNLVSFSQNAANGVLTEAATASLADTPAALVANPSINTPGVTLNTATLYASTFNGANGGITAYTVGIAGGFTVGATTPLSGPGNKLKMHDNDNTLALISASGGTANQLQVFAVNPDGSLGAQNGTNLSVGTGAEHVTSIGLDIDTIWLYVGTDANTIHAFSLDIVTQTLAAETLPTTSCGGTLPVCLESLPAVLPGKK